LFREDRRKPTKPRPANPITIISQVFGSGVETGTAEKLPATTDVVDARVQPSGELQSSVTGMVKSVLASDIAKSDPKKLAGIVPEVNVKPDEAVLAPIKASAFPPRIPDMTASVKVPARQVPVHPGAVTEKVPVYAWFKVVRGPKVLVTAGPSESAFIVHVALVIGGGTRGPARSVIVTPTEVDKVVVPSPLSTIATKPGGVAWFCAKFKIVTADAGVASPTSPKRPIPAASAAVAALFNICICPHKREFVVTN
jgi:hypothetical protein